MRRFILFSGLAAFAFAGTASFEAEAQSIIEVTYDPSTHMNAFVSVDSATGSTTVLKTFKFPSGSYFPSASFEDPATGILYVQDSNGTYLSYNVSTNQLSVINGPNNNGGGGFATPVPGGFNTVIGNIQSGGTTYMKTNMSGPAASATGTNSMAFGAGSSATGNGSVALGSGSVASEDNTVSVGSSTNQRRITEVAPGVDSSDAVNVGQMYGALNKTFGKLDSQMNQTGAMSSAMSQMNASASGIPSDNRIAIGFGTQGGSTAVAFGYQHSLAKDLNFTVGGAVSSNTSTAGVGLGFGW